VIMLVWCCVTLTGVDISDNAGVWCCVTLTGVDISDNAGVVLCDTDRG